MPSIKKLFGKGSKAKEVTTPPETDVVGGWDSRKVTHKIKAAATDSDLQHAISDSGRYTIPIDSLWATINHSSWVKSNEKDAKRLLLVLPERFIDSAEFAKYFQVLCNSGIIDSGKKNRNLTVFQAACHRKNYALAKWILHQGVPLSAVDKHGQNVLHMAVRANLSALVSQILEDRPAIQSLLSSKKYSDSDGNTPLHLAYATHRQNIASLLVDAGFPMTDLNKEGVSCTQYAARNGGDDECYQIVNDAIQTNGPETRSLVEIAHKRWNHAFRRKFGRDYQEGEKPERISMKGLAQTDEPPIQVTLHPTQGYILHFGDPITKEIRSRAFFAPPERAHAEVSSILYQEVGVKQAKLQYGDLLTFADCKEVAEAMLAGMPLGSLVVIPEFYPPSNQLCYRDPRTGEVLTRRINPNDELPLRAGQLQQNLELQFAALLKQATSRYRKLFQPKSQTPNLWVQASEQEICYQVGYVPAGHPPDNAQILSTKGLDPSELSELVRKARILNRYVLGAEASASHSCTGLNEEPGGLDELLLTWLEEVKLMHHGEDLGPLDAAAVVGYIENQIYKEFPVNAQVKLWVTHFLQKAAVDNFSPNEAAMQESIVELGQKHRQMLGLEKRIIEENLCNLVNSYEGAYQHQFRQEGETLLIAMREVPLLKQQLQEADVLGDSERKLLIQTELRIQEKIIRDWKADENLQRFANARMEQEQIDAEIEEFSQTLQRKHDTLINRKLEETGYIEWNSDSGTILPRRKAVLKMLTGLNLLQADPRATRRT